MSANKKNFIGFHLLSCVMLTLAFVSLFHSCSGYEDARRERVRMLTASAGLYHYTPANHAASHDTCEE